MRRKLFIVAVSAIAAVLTAQAAFAHGVWYATRLGKTQLVLGEGPDDRAACLSFLVK